MNEYWFRRCVKRAEEDFENLLVWRKKNNIKSLTLEDIERWKNEQTNY